MLMKKCDNCYIYQVTKAPFCFDTWCHRCDLALWQTRPLCMMSQADICFVAEEENSFFNNLQKTPRLRRRVSRYSAQYYEP